MKDFKKKMTTGIVAGSLFLTAFAPAAFADTSAHNSITGYRSHNEVSIRSNQSIKVEQNNNADIRNNIDIRNSTGGNRSNNNTVGGRIQTGDAQASVYISNMANMNHVTIGQGSQADHNGANQGNGMMQGMKKLHTSLTGSQEVPGPGDADGSGRAIVQVHPEKGQLCVQMWVKHIAPATAAHIHEAPAGAAGPVVVSLPTPNADGYASGCVSMDSNKLTEIKNDPSDYYVNIHNTPYPNGAVRGQLFH